MSFAQKLGYSPAQFYSKGLAIATRDPSLVSENRFLVIYANDLEQIPPQLIAPFRVLRAFQIANTKELLLVRKE